MIIIIILFVLSIGSIIALALTEPPTNRCIHCDAPTDLAPCGAMLCETCCSKCGELKTSRCRWVKDKVMEGQVWD